MNRIILAGLFCVFCLTTRGQIIFEKGYFINNEGLRTECLIKNNDWKDNPAKFEYKLEENGSTTTAEISSVREFSVLGSSRFIRYTVQIDRSSPELNNLTNNRNPEWSNETLFLKVLIQGKTLLLYYEQGNLRRFFYAREDTATQLIYKQFLTQDRRINENITFRSQLWNDVKCPDQLVNSVQKVNYTSKDLEKYFVNYNHCSGDITAAQYAIPKKFQFNFRPTIGANYTTMAITNDLVSQFNAAFNGAFSPRFGLQAEFVLPFNKNKWSFLLEASWQGYHSQRELNIPSYHEYATVNYQSIEFPVGVRHYFHLPGGKQLFLNALFVLPARILIESKVTYTIGSDLDMRPGPGYTFGAGLNKGRFNLELRFCLNNKMLDNYLIWGSKSYATSFIFGYRVNR